MQLVYTVYMTIARNRSWKEKHTKNKKTEKPWGMQHNELAHVALC